MIAPKISLLPLLALLLILFFRPTLAVRADACGDYACGSATWTWDSKTSIKDVSVSVKDTKCDDKKYVYIYLRYQYSTFVFTRTADVLRFENHECAAGYYKVHNTPFLDVGRTIQKIGVFVCRSDALDDTCYPSGYLINQAA